MVSAWSAIGRSGSKRNVHWQSFLPGLTGLPASRIRETLLSIYTEADVPSINPYGLRHLAAILALRETRDV